MTLIEIIRVCPRCGTTAQADQHYCRSCGLDLAAQFELPPRDEWLARRELPSDGLLDMHPIPESRSRREPLRPPIMHYGRTNDASTKAHVRRDRFLGASGITLASSGFLYGIASILGIVDSLHLQEAAGFTVAQGFDFVYAVLLVTGLALAGAAFLSSAGSRPRLLRMALVAIAGAFVADLINYGLAAAEVITHHGSGTFIANTVAWAVSDVPIVIASLLAWTAFAATLSATDSAAAVQRQLRLGWGSILYGVGIFLTIVGSILSIIAYSAVQAPGGFTAGIGIRAGGASILIGATVIAAVAFLRASRHQQTGKLGAVSRRDGLLGTGAIIAGVAFLIMSIGSMVGTSSGASVILTGKEVAAGWLHAIRDLGFSGGLVCAAVGFFLSQRSRA